VVQYHQGPRGMAGHPSEGNVKDRYRAVLIAGSVTTSMGRRERGLCRVRERRSGLDLSVAKTRMRRAEDGTNRGTRVGNLGETYRQSPHPTLAETALAIGFRWSDRAWGDPGSQGHWGHFERNLRRRRRAQVDQGRERCMALLSGPLEAQP
jgi:hypothetical protein